MLTSKKGGTDLAKVKIVNSAGLPEGEKVGCRSWRDVGGELQELLGQNKKIVLSRKGEER